MDINDSGKTIQTPSPTALPRTSTSSSTTTPPPSYPPSHQTNETNIDLECAQPNSPTTAVAPMKFKAVIKTPLGQFWISTFILTVYNTVMLMLGMFLELDDKTAYIAKVIRVAPVGTVGSFLWLFTLGFLCATNDFTFEKTRWGEILVWFGMWFPLVLAPWVYTIGDSPAGASEEGNRDGVFFGSRGDVQRWMGDAE